MNSYRLHLWSSHKPEGFTEDVRAHSAADAFLCRMHTFADERLTRVECIEDQVSTSAPPPALRKFKIWLQKRDRSLSGDREWPFSVDVESVSREPVERLGQELVRSFSRFGFDLQVNQVEEVE